MSNKLKELCKLSKEYFLSSIKTSSTWILISFNLFILYDIIKNDWDISYALFFYLLQMCIYLFFFGILLFSLNSFKTRGKKYSGKGIKTGTAVFVFGIWIFYGIAIYILFSGILNHISGQRLYQMRNLESYFLIGILILFFSIILNFIANFSKEKKRIENTDIVKVFFEPAGNLFPTYVCMVFLAIIGPFAILIKIFVDVIINSPLNAENPFVFQLFGGDERLKEMGYYDESDIHNKKFFFL